MIHRAQDIDVICVEAKLVAQTVLEPLFRSAQRWRKRGSGVV